MTDNGVFIGEDGKPSRTTTIDWPAPPEDIGRRLLYVLLAVLLSYPKRLYGLTSSLPYHQALCR